MCNTTSSQYHHLVVCIQVRVGPLVRCKGQLLAVLDHCSAGDVDVEGGGGGGMDSKLLTCQDKHAARTVLHKDGAGDWTTENAACVEGDTSQCFTGLGYVNGTGGCKN